MVEREQVEQEIKLSLSEAEYLRLHDYLMQNSQFVGCFTQRNIYLETADYKLTHAKEMLRLREVNKLWTITHKSGIKVKDAQFKSNEWELDLGKFSGSLEDLIIKLNEIPRLKNLNNLVVQGELVNIRHQFTWDQLTLELDQSQFADQHVDYELECETNDVQSTTTKLVRLFGLLEIPWVPQKNSKYRRFLEYFQLVNASNTL